MEDWELPEPEPAPVKRGRGRPRLDGLPAGSAKAKAADWKPKRPIGRPRGPRPKRSPIKPGPVLLTPTTLPEIVTPLPDAGPMTGVERGHLACQPSDANLPDVRIIEPEQWQKLVGLVSDGVKITDAVDALGISRNALNGLLRTEEKARAIWEDAKLAALRRHWDMDIFERVLVEVASGCAVGAAIEAVQTADPTANVMKAHEFYTLVLKDPLLKEMYFTARECQAESMIDEIRDISDDVERDRYTDAKGVRRVDNEVVNRSRLKVSTRQWIMARMHYRRFGDRIQQDVTANVIVDHAARLEGARKRKEKGRLLVTRNERIEP